MPPTQTLVVGAGPAGLAFGITRAAQAVLASTVHEGRSVFAWLGTTRELPLDRVGD